MRTLTYVLSYDDLLAASSTVMSLSGAKFPVEIGRASDDGPIRIVGDKLPLPDPFMSGQHAVIERRGVSDVVRDLGSRNGTWVNGARITEHRLVAGDLIEIGHSLLCYGVATKGMCAALEAHAGKPCLGPTETFCPEFAALGQALEKIAPSQEPVLILAETGSGKEVAAKTVHSLSQRAGEFRPVDCGAIPENLFESTFFGHRKGSFTGAEENRTGEIVHANHGTLFLDEVGNMTPATQAKLLRTMETGEVTPVGATKSEQVNVRWIAATNRDLFGLGEEFREDLLRRLAGFTARIPVLRRRHQDLGVLSAYLLREANVEKAAITPAAARILFCDPFPGNIRQLRSTLRSAALLAGSDAIDPTHLPSSTPDEPLVGLSSSDLSSSRNNSSTRSQPTRDELVAVLTQTNGNVVRSSEMLNTHARQIYRWIEKHGLKIEDFRK